MESIIKFDSDPGSKTKLKAFEFTEIALLGVRAFEKQNKNAEALAFLKKHEKKICDPIARLNYLGRLHKALGNEAESVEAYESLLQRNSANLDVYKAIIGAKGIDLPENGGVLDEAQQAIVKGILEEYAEGFPKANAHLRIGLRYLTGDSFAAFLERYLRPLLIKGVPSML